MKVAVGLAFKITISIKVSMPRSTSQQIGFRLLPKIRFRSRVQIGSESVAVSETTRMGIFGSTTVNCQFKVTEKNILELACESAALILGNWKTQLKK